MGDKRLKSTLFSREYRQLWNNLDINIDSYCDKWELCKQTFFDRINMLNKEDLYYIAIKYNIKFDKQENIPSLIYSDMKIAIELYCLMEFSLCNPKAISDFYNIQEVGNFIDKSKVMRKVFDEFKTNNIKNLYLQLLKHEYGKGFFNYNFLNKLKDEDYNSILKFMPYLCLYIKKLDNYSKFYKFRWAYKGELKWIFLLLKESSDTLFPAIPNNLRLLKGTYKLITIYPQENFLEINTRSKWEAYHIKGYISSRLKNPLKHMRIETDYNPTVFFDKLTENLQTNFQLIDATFKRTSINLSMSIRDLNKKNDIISGLKILRKKNILKLNDLSEFHKLIFLFNGLRINVQVEEDKWGRNRFNLVDKRIPKKELEAFKAAFEDRFGIALNKYLRSSDSKLDRRKIVDYLLNTKTVPANIPKDAEEILLDLMDKGIIYKPKKAAKRRCEKCRKITWKRGDCPECGNSLYIEGNFIDITLNKQGVLDYIYNILSNCKFRIRKYKKKIDGKSYDTIDIMNKPNEVITIFATTSTIPDKIIKHYSETGLPLLLVLTQYTGTLYGDILSEGFECIGLTDLYIHEADIIYVTKKIKEFNNAQKRKWLQKLIKKGSDSLVSISNKTNKYDDQNFEIDIYNLLHEIFYVGDRLGGKFAGVPAPDGVVSIQNYGKPLKRGCLAWDCKYSSQKDGYILNDKPEKHRKYIHALKKDSKVKFFGGLLTYTIISNNMNKGSYTKFYFSVKEKFRWKGSILFIDESTLISIYKLFKDNQEKILSKPAIFYSSVYNLFFKIRKKDSDPFSYLSKERLNHFFDEIKSKYKKSKIKLKFKRTDFLK